VISWATTRPAVIWAICLSLILSGAVAFARDVVRRGPPYPKTRDRADKLGTAESNAPAIELAFRRK